MKSPNSSALLLLLASTAVVHAVLPRQVAFVPGLRSRSIQGSSPQRWTTRLQVGTAPPPPKLVDVTEEDNLPQLGEDGIYHILNKEQHQ
jgi:hypothetical protein